MPILTTTTQFPASFELSNLNGYIGIAINGATANDQTGCSVHNVGDINADGITDLIIGANHAFNYFIF